jgi:hypothetical protein
MSQVMAAFRERFKKAAPRRATLLDWEKRSFALGSVKDRPRIGRGSPTSPAPLPWPPRSPDLTTQDNSLWGIIKGRVAARRYFILLTVHLSIILANDQLDAQILCFIIS